MAYVGETDAVVRFVRQRLDPCGPGHYWLDPRGVKHIQARDAACAPLGHLAGSSPNELEKVHPFGGCTVLDFGLSYCCYSVLG